MRRSVAVRVIAGLFIVAGTAHFLIPAPFERIVPAWVPDARAAVMWSGVAEIAGGCGMLSARTRRIASVGLIALLVVVFPANVQMFEMARAEGTSMVGVVILALRLPLQPLLIWWVWKTAWRRDGA